MKHCFTEKNDFVFKESEHGSYFFVVEQGRAEIFSSYNIKKALKRGDCFGELALMYRAPRSAGVYCPEKTSFWALDAKTFQDVLRTIKVAQFQENKKILQRTKFFGRPALTRLLLDRPEVRLGYGHGDPEVRYGQQHNSGRRQGQQLLHSEVGTRR